MSRIKDLLALQEGIDDLMPEQNKYNKAFYDAVNKENIKHIGEQVYAKTLHWEGLREWLGGNAEYVAGTDDEGHTEWYFENFTDLCWEACEDTLDDYIQDQHLDINDSEYHDIVEYARDWLADALADFESECVQDHLLDIKYPITDGDKYGRRS